MWREQREISEAAAKANSASQKAMLFVGEGEENSPEATMSAKEIREWSEAVLIRDKAAQQRGDQVKRSDVVEMLDHLLGTVRNTVMNAPDWLEQEFSLSPRQAEKAQDYFDGLLDEMRLQLERRGYQAAQVVSIAMPDQNAE
jgi:hypothetical protein